MITREIAILSKQELRSFFDGAISNLDKIATDLGSKSSEAIIATRVISATGLHQIKTMSCFPVPYSFVSS